VSTGNAPFQPNVLRYGLRAGSQNLAGCRLWIGGRLRDTFRASVVTTDAAGIATHPAAIPSDVAFEGLVIQSQALARNPGHGMVLGDHDLSDGLAIVVGNAGSACP
jgi:hypothetical protein